MKKTMLFHGLLVLSCLAFSGCQTARMAIPPDLEQQAEVLPCVGRGGFQLKEKLAFGGYEVQSVKRGWTSRFTWDVVVYEHSNIKTKFEFELKTPGGDLWQGHAANGVKRGDTKGILIAGGTLDWGISFDMNYVVNLGLAGQSNGWSLVMEEKGADRRIMKGRFTDGRAVYDVESSRELAGSSIPLMETAGFIIYLGGAPVAAVDLLNEGSVRFDRRLAPVQRDALAAAATALLLYRDISER